MAASAADQGVAITTTCLELATAMHIATHPQ
jgi:hypothetical protein